MNERRRDPRERSTVFKVLRVFVRSFLALFNLLFDNVKDDVSIVFREGKLFSGMFLFLIGFFSFSSDRYCDGSTGPLYTCTRPSTYYYYSWWAILLIVFGISLLLVWYLRKKK